MASLRTPLRSASSSGYGAALRQLTPGANRRHFDGCPTQRSGSLTNPRCVLPKVIRSIESLPVRRDSEFIDAGAPRYDVNSVGTRPSRAQAACVVRSSVHSENGLSAVPPLPCARNPPARTAICCSRCSVSGVARPRLFRSGSGFPYRTATRHGLVLFANGTAGATGLG
jgi:hypothetical protein